MCITNKGWLSHIEDIFIKYTEMLIDNNFQSNEDSNSGTEYESKQRDCAIYLMNTFNKIKKLS